MDQYKTLIQQYISSTQNICDLFLEAYKYYNNKEYKKAAKLYVKAGKAEEKRKK